MPLYVCINKSKTQNKNNNLNYENYENYLNYESLYKTKKCDNKRFYNKDRPAMNRSGFCNHWDKYIGFFSG